MKRVIALLLAAVMTISLVACGNDDTPTTAPADASSATEQGTTGTISADPSETTASTPSDPAEKPTEPKPTEPKPTEPKPTEPKPTEPKPTEPKPTEPKPTEPKPTEPEPTETQHTHSYTDTVTAPTCTERGYTTHTCSCGHSYEDTKTAASGHKWGEWITTKEPTETTEGAAERTCSACSEKEAKNLSVTTHTHNYTKVFTAATCMEASGYTYTCSCGDSYMETVGEPQGHAYGETVTKEATCEADGEATFTCVTCGDTYKETIKKMEHQYSWEEAVLPTCTKDGYIIVVCVLCGDTYHEPDKPAGGHAYDPVVTKEPTCSAEGECRYTCVICADSYTEPVEKETHSYIHTIQNENCAQPTFEVYTCSDCGHSYKEELAPAIGHTWSQWEIKILGDCVKDRVSQRYCYHCDVEEEKAEAKGLHNYGTTGICSGCSKKCSMGLDIQEYDGSCFVFGWGICTDTELVIPDSWNGLPVTHVQGLGSNAAVVSITFPNTVVTVSWMTDCPALERVSLPASVTMIDGNFSGCDSLTAINVDEKNTSYSSADGVLYNKSKTTLILYPHAKSGTSFTVPDSVTVIEDSCFENTKLTSITLPSGLKEIGDYAFLGTDIVSITLSSGLKSIGAGAFDRCHELKSVTIPDSVTSIGDGAFRDCSKLTSIKLPSGLTAIPANLLRNCTALTEVTLPAGVTSIGAVAFGGSGLTKITLSNKITSIGEHAFVSCQNLTSITYGGTQAQWNAIAKGNEWDAYTGSYAVTCTDGIINKA